MAENHIRILQWNCRSLGAPKIGELQKISEDYDIMLLSETWLDFINQNLIKNFTLVQRNRTRPDKQTGGGVAIAIRDNIEFDSESCSHVYYHEKNLETVAISISVKGGCNNLVIVSYYAPTDSQCSKEDWSKLFQSISTFNYKLVGGDANGHHTHWGSDHISTRGEDLYDAIDENELFVLNMLNTGSPTRLGENAAGAVLLSAIDVTIISPNLFWESEWSSTEDNLTSDHFVINIRIFHPPLSFPSRSTHRLNLKKVDWNQFRIRVEEILERDFQCSLQNFCTLSLEDRYERLSQILIEASGKNNLDFREVINGQSYPKLKTLKTPKISPPWWTPECTELVSSRKKAAKELLKDASQANLSNYLELVKKSKARLKQIKTEQFRVFVEAKLSNTSDLNEVWKTVMRLKNRFYDRESHAANSGEYLRKIEAYIEDFCVTIQENSDDLPLRQSNELNYLDVPFSIEELNVAIESVKVDSSPGLDQVENKMLKNSPRIFRTFLLHTLNDLYKMNFY